MTPVSRVVSIVSTKGGVGKTFLASNLAVSLQTHLHHEAALLELDRSGGDVSMMLGKTKVHHMVYPSATNAALPSVLTELRQRFGYVVIDVGSVLTRDAITALEHSNLILLVTTPDVIAINHTNRTIELLGAMKFPLTMMRVIVNRSDSRGNLPSRDLKDQFEAEVMAELPSDGRQVGLSVNRGDPLVLAREGGRLRDSLRRLAKAIVEGPSIFVQQASIDHARLGEFPEVAPGMIPLPMIRSEPLEEAPKAEDPTIVLKRQIHSGLLERLDLKRMDLKTLNDPKEAKRLREKTEKVVLELLVEAGGFVAGRENRERLAKEIVDEALGLGPLEELMADDEISDILVNGRGQIYVEKHGKLHLTQRNFISNAQLLTVIERIIAPLGRRIDESAPMVDARLPDGSRVNAIIHPLSLKGPMLSIRKFSRVRYTIDDLIRFGTLTHQMADFLSMCIRARKNLIVSGGTGSGKTTVLNVLSAFIPTGDRIITIEDAAELRLSQEHWVQLESRPPNIEGRGEITIRNLFRNALRMRPDRILIGECRGDETLDMLQAMNTGHDGSMTTLHANSPQDVISRLDSLVLMSNIELPIRAIREQIVAAVDVIAHTSRLSDGSRKMTHITEITGMTQHGNVTFKDIFRYAQRGVTEQGEVLGGFQATGEVPSFLEDLKAKGMRVDEAMFRPSVTPHPASHQ